MYTTVEPDSNWKSYSCRHDHDVFSSEQAKKELNANWVVLAEAIQVILRKSGRHNAYEQLKKLTRGVNIDSKAKLKHV